MKIKLLSTLLLFIYHSGFCQTEKILIGHVFFENTAVANVEVINANSKIVTISDTNGAFSIVAKTNDMLVLVSKIYELKTFTIQKQIFDRGSTVVYLALKPEELKEVVVTNIPSIKLSKDAKWEQGKIDKMALEKAASKPKILGVYTGNIENGMDLLRIGGMVFNLFRKEKEDVKKVEIDNIDFITLAKTNCDPKFYTENLNLKPEEIPLFLQFCDADPKSKALIENSNVLSMMDFLSTKNIEFKKL